MKRFVPIIIATGIALIIVIIVIVQTNRRSNIVSPTLADNHLTGLGATTANWDRNHRSNDPRYTYVKSPKGAINAYTLRFIPATTIKQAVNNIMKQEVPRDSKIAWTNLRPSCFAFAVRSPQLTKAGGTASFRLVSAPRAQHWNPNHITGAYVALLRTFPKRDAGC